MNRGGRKVFLERGSHYRSATYGRELRPARSVNSFAPPTTLATTATLIVAPSLTKSSRQARPGVRVGLLLVGTACGTIREVAKRDKILRRALDAPHTLRFDDLCYLARAFGFEERRGEGSHRVFRRPGHRPLSFQNCDGMAKRYQVNQLLDALRDLALIRE